MSFNPTSITDIFCKSIPFNLVMLRRYAKNIFFLDPRSEALAKTELGQYIQKNIVFGNFKYALYSEVSGHIKISRQKKVLFVTIGKNASSKVLASILEDLLGKRFSSREEYMAVRDRWYEVVEPDLPIEKDIDSLINDPSLFKFTFVRNPYTKLVSAWKNRIQDKSSFFHNIGYYRDIRKYTFPELVDFLYQHKEKPSYFDQHWLPQNIAMYHPLVDYDFIGHLENFDRDLTHVLEQIGAGAECINNISQKMNATRPSKLSQFYTPEIQEKVYEIYKKDFELFGYSKDLPDNL